MNDNCVFIVISLISDVKFNMKGILFLSSINVNMAKENDQCDRMNVFVIHHYISYVCA